MVDDNLILKTRCVERRASLGEWLDLTDDWWWVVLG
jgi:hypothetical protein